jgi:hypothetical protein
VLRRQHVREKYLKECGLFVEQFGHSAFLYGHDQAFFHAARSRRAQRLVIQTSFTEKGACLKNGEHRFFALFRHNRELNPALLQMEDSVRRISLGENHLIDPVESDRSDVSDLAPRTIQDTWR